MMVLLCYVNLSGMSLESIVRINLIVLMNNSLLGGQECTDYADVQQDGDSELYNSRLAILPRLNFTCNGRITNIRARVSYFGYNDIKNSPYFQVWRHIVNTTTYNKIGEVQLQSDSQVTFGSNNYREANITLTSNNTIEFQSGDVVGYYHPSNSRYHVRDIATDGYTRYRFNGPNENSVDLTNRIAISHLSQPLLQFLIGTIK